MNDAAHLAILPRALPDCPNEKLLLFVLRRMASAGLDDAHAAHALLAGFRARFRRPLVLIRALMAEVSRASTRVILVAPCCALRMTEAEASLLRAVRDANSAPRAAHAGLEALLASGGCLGVLSSAQAVEQAFEDLGRPLARA